MNVPIPPLRRAPGGSPAKVLTDKQRAEAWAWFQEWRRVGTFTTKARELGVRPNTLRNAIVSLRRRAGEDL